MRGILEKSLGFAKKAILVLAVYFLVISLFSFFINKDKSAFRTTVDPIKKNRAEIYKVINDEKTNSTKEGKLSIILYKSLMCNMIGEACSDNPQDADANYKKSVFGFIGGLLAYPYANPPASGVYWAYSSLSNAGFIPKSYAAEGVGFAAISPYVNIWKIFRDVSYMLLVMVLIGIGFMIMFRMKMNAQTVVSVENSLPKIVVSLILITFSFAIAGFMIDLMYVIVGLVVSVLSNNPAGGTFYDANVFKNDFMGAKAGDLWGHIRVGLSPNQSIGYFIGESMLQIMPTEINIALRSTAGFIAVILSSGIVNFIAGLFAGMLNAIDVLGNSLGNLLQPFLGIPIALVLYPFIFILVAFHAFPAIFSVLILFSIAFLFLRIILLLFSSYLKLVITIILAPFLLLFEAVPGRNAFKFWIMNLIGNLIAFPITIGILILGYIIVNDPNTPSLTARLPYLYGLDNNSFRVLVGMGLIFLIPDLIKVFKELLGIKDLPISIGLGTFFGGVSAGTAGATSLLGQFGSISLGLSAITGKGLHDLMSGDKNFGKQLGGSLKSVVNPSAQGKSTTQAES